MSHVEIRNLKKKLQEKTISIPELVEETLQNCVKAQESTNSFITIAQDEARARATELQKQLDSGKESPLLGIPYAAKDIFTTKNIRTTCASKILENYIPPYESTVTARLQRAGAVLIGKTNMDEFAMGSSNENSAYGDVKNPLDPERVPGGSSGGSAAIVGSKAVPVALGTDTGGSIRQPCAFTGTVGIKPTYGRVSRFGMIAFASSLDQAGPIAQTVDDCAYFLQEMAGDDEFDSTSLNVKIDDYVAASEKGKNSPEFKKIKIGIPRQYFIDGLDAEISDRIESIKSKLSASGAELVDIDLPHTEYATAVYYVVAVSEASSNLARYDGVRFGLRDPESSDLTKMYELTRSLGFGPEVKRRIILGTYALSAGYYDAYYAQACKVRRLIRNDFLNAFQDVDCILAPVTPTPAFKLAEKSDDPLKMYLNDIFTIPANLAGIPALALKAGKTKDGLPIGIQLLGKDFAEANLLQWGSSYETLFEELQ